jgi:hypothetical protein
MFVVPRSAAAATDFSTIQMPDKSPGRSLLLHILAWKGEQDLNSTTSGLAMSCGLALAEGHEIRSHFEPDGQPRPITRKALLPNEKQLAANDWGELFHV